MSTLGERIKEARKQAGLTQGELHKLSKVSQQMLSKLETNKSDVTTSIVPLARALGVNIDWLQSGTGPMKPNGEFVTDILQTDELESAKLENPIMSNDNNGSTNDVIKALERFRDKLYDFRVVPVIGKIVEQEGQAMLVEQDLGHVGFYSSDPAVKCYEETTNKFSPTIKARQAIVVSPGIKPGPLDEVIIIMKDNRALVKELVSEIDDGYYLDDINEKNPREFVNRADIKNIFVILDVYRRARLEPRPFVPKIPPWVKEIIESGEPADNTEC